MQRRQSAEERHPAEANLQCTAAAWFLEEVTSLWYKHNPFLQVILYLYQQCHQQGIKGCPDHGTPHVPVGDGVLEQNGDPEKWPWAMTVVAVWSISTWWHCSPQWELGRPVVAQSPPTVPTTTVPSSLPALWSSHKLSQAGVLVAVHHRRLREFNKIIFLNCFRCHIYNP